MVVLGLGNPGDEYAATRHNCGFMVVDYLGEKTGIELQKKFFKKYIYGKGVFKGKEIFLVKPLTFMNASGNVIRDVLKAADCTTKDIIVVCDNMDLFPGVLRIKRGGGDAGHNGLKSIMTFAPANDFLRMYIGIGRPPYSGDVSNYVLGVPDKIDRDNIAKAVEKAGDSILSLTHKTVEQVTNEINAIKNISQRPGD
ncbi:MAG: aminoacyl-tRNA hydrolase [Spirochaetia bacterium]|nr:aminoacyl-tRNA hydrolase [Spirochaetia bacterium]MBP5739789.1 aminoacyl-tRNA hydrolase [Spirochaetia bacterium]